MEVLLLVVGKTTAPHISAGIDIYEKRLRRYIPFKIGVVPDIKKRKVLTEDLQKENEGKAILEQLQPNDHVVLLDEKGRQFTSVEFSDRLRKHMSSGLKRLVFVVGGPYGFSEAVYARSDSRLSLSAMTFNHEMVRMFFVEQIYRAMTIMRGEPYHHI